MLFLFYLALGTVWVVGFNDFIFPALGSRPDAFSSLHTLEDWLFIVASASILFVSIRRQLKVIERKDEEIRRTERASSAGQRRQEERIREQFNMLGDLFSGAQQLSESLDMLELAKSVVDSSVERFSAKFAWLSSAEPDGKIRALAQNPEGYQYTSLFAATWDDADKQGPTGRAIRTGLPVIVADLANDASFAPWRETAVVEGLHTCGSFPLISRNKTFGALSLYSDEPGFFTTERIRFFQAYAHQAAAALENARLYEETQHRANRLNALCTIDTVITSSHDLRATLNVYMDQVISQLGVDAADVMILDPHTLILEYAAGRGFRSKSVQGSYQRLGDGNAGRAALNRDIVAIRDLSQSKDPRAELFKQEQFVFYYAAPLITKGQVKGVLELFHRSSLDPDAEWLNFLEVLSSQAAIAVENASLFDDLQRSNVELALAYDTTLEGWSRAMDLRDRVTEGHAMRVTKLTLDLARAVGISEQSLMHVRRGALLHDIGKMAIPDNILMKPGPLSHEEVEIMRRHPVYALELLSPITYLRPAITIPYLHHEKWDGSGYPQGLKGEQIPIAARVFAVVDVWDALTSERPYREPWPKQKVLEYIRNMSGVHFDPSIVQKFLAMTGDEAFSY